MSSLLAKVVVLSYDSAAVAKTSALKSYYRSVRLIRDENWVNPTQPSYITNILLCGNCIDAEKRNLYVFYIDTFFHSAWIIEINIDSRAQKVVYFDKNNDIGFDPNYKIYNPRVVHGRLVWTDNLNPIYQMDIERAKRSFRLKIGYGQYPIVAEWSNVYPYGIDQIVSNGNNFYKNLVDNNLGTEPKFDDGTNWEKMCLIEDAYYSMNVDNFLLEAVPPKHPPLVEYQSDPSRKINNLRQTLFQFAYRYVYMDWRKSTFSPASIVAVPQAEEETATGLASEQISLNNKFQIQVNSGGEEVRAIEIIGRSSEDPSKWYLVETINKFGEQERGNELSCTSEPDVTRLLFNPLIAKAVGDNSPTPLYKTLGMSAISPVILNSYIDASPGGWAWLAVNFGIEAAVAVTIYCVPEFITFVSAPDWLVVEINGYPWPQGETIKNGDVLSIYPRIRNLGGILSGLIVLSNSIGDSANIAVTHSAFVVDPLHDIHVTILSDPLDTSGLIVVDSEGSGLSGGDEITLYCNLTLPEGIPANAQTVFWRALINGVAAGYGLMSNLYFEVQIEKILTLDRTLNTGDNVIIYLSIQPVLESLDVETPMSIIPLRPIVINSQVSLTTINMQWVAEDFGTPHEIASVVNCPPDGCMITSKPDWITIIDSEAGYELGLNSNVFNGQVLFLFPTEANISGAKYGSVIFANTQGDSASIYVTQDAGTPPAGMPIDCTILKYSGDPSILEISSVSAIALTGENRVTWSCVVTGWYGGTIYWKAYKNGNVDLQGSGSFMEQDGYDSGEFVLDSIFLPWEVITIYFSTIPF